MIRAQLIKKLENSSVGYESDVVSFSVDEESYYDDCGSLLLLTLKRNPIDEKQVWDSKALKIQIPYRINQSCVERRTTNTARLTWYKQWDCTEALPRIEANMRSIWVLGGANQISYRQKRAWILGRGIIYVRM